MKAVPLAALSLVAAIPGAACGDAALARHDQPAQAVTPESVELSVRVVVETSEVAFGKAFPLTVTRTWHASLIPGAWDDRALLPLVLAPAGVDSRRVGPRIEEVRRYRAYAFDRDRIAVPAVPVRAVPRDGGPERVASAEGFSLGVLPALPGDDAGVAELPREVFPAPVPWLEWLVLGAAVLGVIALSSWFARWQGRRPAPRAPALPPRERARQRLQALRAMQPTDREQLRAYHVEASHLLRDFIEHELALLSPGMTTEEFFASPSTTDRLHPGQRRALAGVLELCDLTKFARHEPEAAQRERLLDAIGDFLDAPASAPEYRPAETLR